MATMTKQEKLIERFPKGRSVAFILGRGHRYVGKVERVEKGGYLRVTYKSRHGYTEHRRINADNAKLVRA